MNFALALHDFDVAKHQPHPPGYPIYVAVAKLVRLGVADDAAALTMVSSLSGAAVAAMFYVLVRRQLSWSVSLFATIIVALSPLFWLQAGLALSDMFGLIFLMAFMLIEGASTQTPRGDLLRRIFSGIIAGLSLGARPHLTLLIITYWIVRALYSRKVSCNHFLTAVGSVLAGAGAWLVPTCLATGGLSTYVSACLSQFDYRLDKPGVSVLGAHISGSYLLSRASSLIGRLGQTFAPIHITKGWRFTFGPVVLAPYVFFAWRSESKDVARPYIIASAVYLTMLFVLLPTSHQRYFLPFCFIVGWSVPGILALVQRPLVRGAVITALLVVNVVPSLFLIGGLSDVPPPVAAINWVSSSRPTSILYSEGLKRHATFYWPEGDARPEPKTQTECDDFRKEVASNRIVLSTSSALCGIDGKKIVSFKRDPRVHDKHRLVSIFDFGTVAR